MALKRSTIYVDAAGSTRQSIIYTSTGGAGIEADVLAVSNAKRLDQWEGTPGGATGASTAATYESVFDYALMEWACADGSVVSLYVPAPKSTIFKADQQTVDITVAAVATLSAAVIGNLLAPSGSAAASYLGGLRRRKNRDYP